MERKCSGIVSSEEDATELTMCVLILDIELVSFRAGRRTDMMENFNCILFERRLTYL